MFLFPLFILWFGASSLLLSYIQSSICCGGAHSICNKIFSVIIRYLSFTFSVNYPLVNNPIIIHSVNNPSHALEEGRCYKNLSKVHWRRPSFLKLPVFNIREHEVFFLYLFDKHGTPDTRKYYFNHPESNVVLLCKHKETLSDASLAFAAEFTAGVMEGTCTVCQGTY